MFISSGIVKVCSRALAHPPAIVDDSFKVLLITVAVASPHLLCVATGPFYVMVCNASNGMVCYSRSATDRIHWRADYIKLTKYCVDVCLK